ncbi:MAG: hypothetical protein HOV79_27620 [Hamadaea sp.]|nr:hypothetical protein [Hamadaea sp.]
MGLIAGVLALCLAGVCAGGVALYYLNGRDEDPTPRPTNAALATGDAEPSDLYSPETVVTTEAAPPPAPVDVGDCISVDTAGSFQGVGNCNGSRGTYKVLSVDYRQGTCSDPESPYITVDGYRLCLALYLVRTYCYKFPSGPGWVVAAPKCKAKGTVHVIDIVPGASNGNKCTNDYKWNRWYRFTHPTVVYCVMQY